VTVYVYGITDAPPPAVEGVTGIEGAGVSTLARGDVAAAFAALPGDGPPSPTPDALMEHERVVEALMRSCAVLPTRFGTTLADADALGTVLERQADSFRERLERVRGCVEVGVRVRWAVESPVAGAAESDPVARGREYLDARRGDLREADRATMVVHGVLTRLARASTWSTPAVGGLLLGAYLVAADDVPRFADEVRRLQDADASFDVSCTGPWPPYSFAESS
jgi:hypothetical protein